MKLYHREIFWKDYFNSAVQRLISTENIKVTRHIKVDNVNRTHCQHNKININSLVAITYEAKNRVRPYYLFEVETNEFDNITKAVFRTDYNTMYDIVIVVRKNLIVTAWLQKKADTHRTLDVSKYYKP